MDQELTAEIDAVLNEYEALWDRQDPAGLIALWDQDDPEPFLPWRKSRTNGESVGTR